MNGGPVDVFVGIGSNLERPEAQVKTALTALARLPSTTLLKSSPLYRSAPMGPPDQPSYINAVARLQTGLGPEPLLDLLQEIESNQGRVRAERWGPRVIDLDLLLYGSRQIDSPRLRVPHPGIADRAFVLVPLHDIAPGIGLPGVGPLAALMTPGVFEQVESLA
jgi:2-amino-4-hydroxy-6-hydroxymethyldihydropteridine diphosphokinase